MLWMPKIFSDNALFLQNAPLDLLGKTEPNAAVFARIAKDGATVSEGHATADGDGRFSLRVMTPKASFDTYTVEVFAGEECRRMEGILFGELWLACGQSNMELPNYDQPEWEEMRERIKGKPLRFYDGARVPAPSSDYPSEPQEDTNGWWMTADESDKVAHVSALATVFSDELYTFLLTRGEEVPVGFLNCNRGGTRIETWLPAWAFEKFPAISHRAPDYATWNKHGDGNMQQPTSHYNSQTHAHLGVKARGVLWYQGEGNLGDEQSHPIYRDFLIALRDSYKELFAASEDEVFPVIAAHLYPYKYTEVPETYIGYFNRSLTELAKADPLHHPVVPLCDLSPIWTYHLTNHPIHPAHKYALGRRFALLCENIYYGRKKARLQTLAPMLKSCVRHGNKLRLTFENVGDGLYIDGERIKGLYIRARGGAYTPAMCEIVSRNVMNVWHPYIEKPLHAAYAVSSHETGTNLMAGEFPVVPFCTEFSDAVRNVSIGMKPWLDMTRDSEFFIADAFTDPFRDAGQKPNYFPLDGSAVCYDKIYTRSTRSLRIEGEDRRFGAYIKAAHGAPLDFANYAALRLDLYNAARLNVALCLFGEDSEEPLCTLAGGVEENLPYGWARIIFDLRDPPKDKITRAEFRFEEATGNVPFANIENLVLEPK